MTQRAWIVNYAGLAESPSRTISGEVLVTASSLRVAAARAVKEIDRREGRRGRPARLRSVLLRITRGRVVDRAAATHIERGPAPA